MEIPILIYDGECPLCLRAQVWLAQRVPPDALFYMPCQSPDRAVHAPQVTEAACMEAMHLVLPDGQVFVGDQAFPPLLRLVPGYAWLGRVLTWPGVRHLAPLAYGWVALHRLRFSPLFARKMRDGACKMDGDCR